MTEIEILVDKYVGAVKEAAKCFTILAAAQTEYNKAEDKMAAARAKILNSRSSRGC